jgi:ATP-dependent helicase/nuclease subunit B
MLNAHSRAAGILVEDQAQRLPDLSGIVLLVPHAHVTRPFLAALRARIAEPVFLPPRFLTLPALAESVAAAVPGQPDSRRLVELHAFLRRVPSLPAASAWPTARELLQLLRELDDALLAPPDTFDDFARRVAGAGRRILARPLEMEARLAFDVWRAFLPGNPGTPPGGGAAYAARLAHWLAGCDGPIYSLGLSDLSPLEARFLAGCAARGDYRELPSPDADTARQAFLDAAWSAASQENPARKRASDFARLYPNSPIAGRVALAACPDLEALAQGVAVRLRQWLAEGRRHIGIVALDRLAARRLRAVLERENILLQDETGWTFSTAVVSHVLDRWHDLVANGAYHRDLFDLLKSRFLFADLPEAERFAAVHALERAARREGLTQGLDRFIELARRQGLAGVLPLLSRLAEAQRQFTAPGRLPLATWLQRMLAVLDRLGAHPLWLADSAGRQLLDLLQRLGRELEGDGHRVGFKDWRAWLTLQLDTATFLDDAVESPVRLTHLAAARLREFDAVILLGADAAHLPARTSAALFSDAARQELGLPGQVARRDAALSALRDLFGGVEQSLIVWQESGAAGPNPPSPWLELLDLFHRLAYGQSLRVELESPAPGLAALPPPPGAPTLAKLAERLSASAWQTLVQCPYRYFARYGLGLWQEDEVGETMEKRDYGDLVHAILARFHARHPVLLAEARPTLDADLRQFGRETFARWLDSDPFAQAWWLRWERRLDAYLDWALERESQGYRWQAAEQGFEHPLDCGEAGTLRLEGRLDRIDRQGEVIAVLDYKTLSRAVLRRKLKIPGEDVQLPFYALLTGAREAAFVGLDDDTIANIGVEGDLGAAAQAEAMRIAVTFAALAGGARLPAQGTPEVCEYCEMRGLCRREHR